MNVELRHLRALVAIGDVGTISGAARLLRISQPALSRTLEQLESRIGTPLVERTTRRLALTDAGRVLHERSHAILNQVDDALAQAATGPRPLRVGFAWALLGERTTAVLRAWRERFPETPVRLYRRDDPEAALRRGELDMAVVRTMPAPDGDVIAEELYSEDRLVAVPDGHPLMLSGGVRLADLADHPVVVCSTAATTAGFWVRGRQPHIVEVDGVDEWLTVIAIGEALGVTTEGTGHSHPHPGVRYLPITDAGAVTVRLLRPLVPTHPAAEAFADHARKAVGGS
ncbi:LysR family transcriptional regulator [Actinoplanes italicus]|uniref:DNA-binding transcriptional LysR family regulator n=1 Tax=Actinoplanes italicus TaxID=113567 RepID=A0A2T0KES2_9ACTN|nr:LysR family transcriptional regulator [Actinoplanes italicus]PRX21883.1 DNA-binding transcriptional LysR family regulator [Actinoplanes italicus]GIE29699.1 LysR family transcriptional regulator [Actinoplanes italicus]